MSVENHVLNLIIQTGDYGIIRRNRLEDNLFPAYEDEFTFIIKHYSRYHQIPDKVTFLIEFPDFEWLEISESPEYLTYRLREARMYSLTEPVIKEASEIAREDAIKAVDFLKAKTMEIAREMMRDITRQDLIKNADERLKEYEERRERKGLLGITTGIPKLDDLTYGWLKNDFIVISARLNEGKSWVMLFFLMIAWKEGYRPLFFSLENPTILMGFRFDTLYQHWNNIGLMSGKEDLGAGNNEDYAKYIKELMERHNFFIFTNEQNGGKPYTPSQIESIIEELQPDIVGIDQLSLLVDDEHVRETRIRYVNITRAFRAMTNRLGIPIMLNAQANRQAAKEAKKQKDRTPEVDELSESDSTGQDATRVISFKPLGRTAKLSLKKNTYGLSGEDIDLKWDVNIGDIKQMGGASVF